MAWSTRIAVLVALGTLGCAARQVQLQHLVKAGYENELLASEEFKGERLAVSGEVEDRGLKSKQEFQSEIEFGPFNSADAKGQWVTTKYPYVFLISSGEFNARLFCKFDNDLRRDVGLLNIGDTVTLTGDFSGYWQSSRGKVAMLHDCDIAP
ncbi:MAG TPA: hypothetical protein VHO25_10445 [Polyangiaceae bacterium]|nr:hypothetical protein [Polyangiaceae bacterium]